MNPARLFKNISVYNYFGTCLSALFKNTVFYNVFGIESDLSNPKTIIFASHILDEVEKICSHVAIMKQGHLLAAGPFSDILQSEQHLLVAAEDTVKLQEWVKSQSFIAEAQPEGALMRHG